MIFRISSILAPILLATGSFAQIITYTLPYADGNTLLISTGLGANGLPTTRTLSTLVAGAGGGGVVVTAPTTTPTTTTRNTRLTTTTATTPRVGQDTALPPPMKTTTYYYPVAGYPDWQTATWTASVTGLPSVATANVAAGTIQDYNAYQSSVNQRVFSSAQAAAAAASVSKAAGDRTLSGGQMAGWVGLGVMGLGAVVGAGLLL